MTKKILKKKQQSGLERIEAALQVLYEEGLTHIKPEYQKDYPRFQL